MVAFRLCSALFAFGLAVSCREVSLEICPVLVVGWQVEPVVAVVVVCACFVYDGIRSIDKLVVGESSVAGLGVGLNFLDSAVERLNGLIWVPLFIEAFSIGSEVDGCDVSEFIEEILDEDVDGDVFVSDVVVVVRI